MSPSAMAMRLSGVCDERTTMCDTGRDRTGTSTHVTMEGVRVQGPETSLGDWAAAGTATRQHAATPSNWERMIKAYFPAG